MSKECSIGSGPLATRRCVPCEGGVPALTGQQIHPLLKQLDGAWEIVNQHHLTRTFTFEDFRQALDFTNAVGELAEQEGHHPEITLTWGKATVRVWTHKIDGLTESDFVLAAKIDGLRPHNAQAETP